MVWLVAEKQAFNFIEFSTESTEGRLSLPCYGCRLRARHGRWQSDPGRPRRFPVEFFLQLACHRIGAAQRLETLQAEALRFVLVTNRGDADLCRQLIQPLQLAGLVTWPVADVGKCFHGFIEVGDITQGLRVSYFGTSGVVGKMAEGCEQGGHGGVFN